MFGAYCSAHGWLDGAPASLTGSLRWGLFAGAPFGVLAWSLWVGREQIGFHIARGWRAALLFLGGVLLLLLIGGPALHLVAAQTTVADTTSWLVKEAFDFLPLALAVTAALAGGLLAMRPAGQKKAVGPVLGTEAPQWLEFPEAAGLRVRRADATLVRAAGNYCELHVATRVYLVRTSIKNMADRLAQVGFLRVHRSAIVNLDRLRSIDVDKGQAFARLDDGTHVRIGRSFRGSLEAALSARSSRLSDVRP